ncbi:hypothetical protein DFQ26_004089 [Actinomortierella ambigua]|nr:hypothetical protein DFQ26_004089 [Actinomortierella ambigua]
MPASTVYPAGVHQPRHTPSAECRRPPAPAPLTDSQKSALDQVRTQIHSDAITPRPDQKRWANDACLLRYLRGRKWNVEEAKQAIENSIRWRDEFGPDRPDRKALWLETTPGKIYVSGFDGESRPLVYMRPRLENTQASDTQIKHVVFHLETALALMPEGVEALTIVIDFHGSSMRTSPGAAVAKQIIDVLGSQFPERLGKAYIIHAPWFFFPFYKLISPWIDPVTKAKIHFVDMKKQKQKSSSSSSSTSSSSASSPTSSEHVQLLDAIPLDMLEQEYGGASEYKYDQEIYWQACERALAVSRTMLQDGCSRSEAEAKVDAGAPNKHAATAAVPAVAASISAA